jgi:hypothetical protein
MAAGADVALIGGYLGMTPEVLRQRYGHHHPRWQEEVARADRPSYAPETAEPK